MINYFYKFIIIYVQFSLSKTDLSNSIIKIVKDPLSGVSCVTYDTFDSNPADSKIPFKIPTIKVQALKFLFESDKYFIIGKL